MNMVLDLKEILKPINNYLEKVDETIKTELKTGVPIIDNTSLHLFIKGGKKIRASLVILASGLKSEFPEGIAEVAAATEICHAATLVHDDIIDQSMLRRGDATVSKKWGNKVAVLIGDYMYTKALDTIVKQGDPALFPVIVTATNEMVQGELYQLQYSDINVINREHYLKIIELKTARFMAACTKLGGLKAGLSESDCENLYQFGMNIGFAFQVIDDTLDLIEDEITGKDAGNDFMDGKVTLPFIYLLENADKNEKKRLISLAANPGKNNWEIVRKELQKSGAIKYSIDISEVYINKAFSIINEFPQSVNKEILIKIAGFFVNRNY